MRELVTKFIRMFSLAAGALVAFAIQAKRDGVGDRSSCARRRRDRDGCRQ